MSIELPALPYADDALAPHISAETISFHYGKHHAAYVNNLNGMLEDGDDRSLEQIIEGADGALFNNAAQVWNHTFYWNSMSPDGGGEPGGELGDAIAGAFGSFDSFRTEFTQAAMTQFGSGWAWLVDDGSGLSIMKTANADLPMVHSAKAVLTIDVWEHAYYIDYRNARPTYVATFLDSLVNWDHAALAFSA
ncbi:MAG: superoxide dismutase [Actinomycetia bacterium]|nr:superoxide dismutase [Actinomycetes bacterium]MCP4961463.1 superoxide dismutase [Actinomycetes bacterium]